MDQRSVATIEKLLTGGQAGSWRYSETAPVYQVLLSPSGPSSATATAAFALIQMSGKYNLAIS